MFYVPDSGSSAFTAGTDLQLPVTTDPAPARTAGPPQYWHQPPAPAYQYPVVVIAGTRKSVGLAALLGFLFGPLGLLYSTVGGAVLLFLIDVVVAFLTFGLGLFVTWPIAAIWGAIAASQHNARMTAVTVRPPP